MGRWAPELVLRRIHLENGDAQASLQQMLAAFHQSLTEPGADPATLYREESVFLQTHLAVPLLYLPRALWCGDRASMDWKLSADGLPELGDVSLEDAK